ncbi:transglutaminase-like cysteine peptidase [Bauldia litoralis]|uniref:Predicted transglutaminase-like cysteine proteinase n=1 Tax=Bauldia litoralis TaxID=665467 RepID=A0A1G6EP04_9HYPH|nr:transglutaminase-like cysteine peptidase [Bauldia litoralis]SDB59191.1 Predicted transglutaminase-like cysteine proteinase [Bauldia litoralis]
MNYQHQEKTSSRILLCTVIAFGGAFLADLSAAAGFTPPAFGAFCLQNPIECKRNGPVARAITLTVERERDMREVNRRVNDNTLQRTDLDIYGIGDIWALPKNKTGDCEDLALLKRHQLIAKGWPSSVLLMTVVRNREGLGHAVLTVVTSDGDFILDNDTSEIVRSEATGYRFFSRQSASDPKRWVAFIRDRPEALPVALAPGNLATEEDRSVAAVAEAWRSVLNSFSGVADLLVVAALRGAPDDANRRWLSPTPTVAGAVPLPMPRPLQS